MPDYYSDGEGPDAMTRQAKASNSAHADETPVGENQPTGLLPKSILGGEEFQAGDELVVKITRIMDDQVEVVFVSKGSSEEESEPAEAPMEGEPAPSEGSQMRSYME